MTIAVRSHAIYIENAAFQSVFDSLIEQGNVFGPVPQDFKVDRTCTIRQKTL